MKKETKWFQYIWIALLVIFLVFTFIFRAELGRAIIPFFLALLIASMIEPLVVFLQTKLKLNRTLSSLLGLIIFILILTVILTIVLVFGINQIWTLASQLPKNQQRIATDMTNLLKKLRDLYPKFPPEYLVYLETLLSNLFSSIQVIITKTLNLILMWAASLPNVIIVTLMTFLATYFITKDRATISQSILRILPFKWQSDFKHAAAKAIKEIIGFIKGQLFLSLLTLILSIIFLGPLLRSPYWMVLSVILAFLDIIPILGPSLILLPWAVIALFLGYTKIFWITSLLYVAIVATRQGLQPKILGSYTGIHPLLMLFSIYAGLIIFGVWGFFTGPIVVIVLRAFIGFIKRIEKV